jgi:hypothetical protein
LKEGEEEAKREDFVPAGRGETPACVLDQYVLFGQ